MTWALAVVVLGVVMLLAGGPSNFMYACELALRSVAESVYQGWVTFRG